MHDLGLARVEWALSDSIAVLKDGRLIADDLPEAISRNAEVQAAYFGGGIFRA